MLDIHTHILPGVDDGAKDLSESLAMAKQAAEEGITGMIATPHHKNGRYDNDRDAIVHKVNQLNRALEQQGIELEVRAGQEIRVYPQLISARVGSGKLNSFSEPPKRKGDSPLPLYRNKEVDPRCPP